MLILDRDAVAAQAEKAGLFLYGFTRESGAMKIFMIAGEPSGDLLGQGLIRALRDANSRTSRFPASAARR